MRFGVLIVAAVALLACPNSTAPATCSGKTTACDKGCAALGTDDSNCGSCAKACPEGTRCGGGACLPTSCADAGACDATSACWHDRCVARDCVGVVCSAGQLCSGGTCACDSRHTECGGRCVDTKTSDTDCGACGAACQAGERCGGGACLPEDCPTANCDPLSACYRGACAERACIGVLCPPGLSCVGGLCGCEPGELLCGSACTRLATDSRHCGVCGRACPADQRCAAGECLPQACGDAGVCDSLSVCFLSQCVTAACVGVACPSGSSCEPGTGTCRCPPGQVNCSGACVALGTDDMNCGVCGNRCAAGQACLSGNCTVTGCPAGKRVCGASCVDTQTDPDHCGACGAACGGGRVCVGGACQCPMGLTYCQGNCVDLLTDEGHCGGCGKTCGGGTCAAGVCNCPAGQSPCNGTCVDTRIDPLNCGLCNRTCAATQACVSSFCVCAPGRTLCAGTCLPTASDNNNCGNCGLTCPTGQYCSSSMCVPEFTCQTNFNSAPADCPLFPLDESRCGTATLSGSTPFSGFQTVGTTETRVPVSLAGEHVEIKGSTGTVYCICDLFVRSAGDGTIVTQTFSTQGGTSIDLRTTSSPYTCSHPASVALRCTWCNVVAGVTYNTTIEKYLHAGKWNTGGTTAGTGSTLANNAASGRVCDQVCGDVKLACGDDRQHYKLTLPPGKAAVIEASFTGRASNSTFRLLATQLSGGLICNLVPSGSAGTTPVSFKSRLVNNTSTAQTITLAPLALTGSLHWQLAVAVEP